MNIHNRNIYLWINISILISIKMLRFVVVFKLDLVTIHIDYQKMKQRNEYFYQLLCHFVCKHLIRKLFAIQVHLVRLAVS